MHAHLDDPPEPERSPSEPSEPTAASTPDGAEHGGSEPVGSEQPVAQPKSSYQLPTKKNTSLRNMMWALSLTMLLVAAAGIVFFGVGTDPERKVLEGSQLDVEESAARAQGAAGFPVAVPELDEGWEPRSGRFADGGSPSWELSYSSPEGQLVTVVQEAEVTAPMLSSAVPDASVDDEFEIDGADCQALSGGTSDDPVAGIACEGDGWGLVTSGQGDADELEHVARAAIASLD